MKQFLNRVILLMVFLTTIGINASAQPLQTERKWEDIENKGFYQKQTDTQNGITLVYINKDSLFNKNTGQNIINAFWKVYPQEVKRFNPKSINKVTILISDEYKGVAATLNGVIKINPGWMKAHPEDIDVITHELMHVVQDYGNNEVPWWLTEGIADYARNQYGVNNEKSGWLLTEYKPGQRYDNGYRITARFLVWIEKNSRKDIVDRLNEAMHTGQYSPGIWAQLTGKTVDDLWKEYSLNPAI